MDMNLRNKVPNANIFAGTLSLTVISRGTWGTISSEIVARKKALSGNTCNQH
jgi:hypothetical protein